MGMVTGIKLISNMVIKVIQWSSSVRSVITATEPKILNSRTGLRTKKTGGIGAEVSKKRIVPCMAIKVTLKSCSVSK